jgi:GT2 family glycosyltransferase
MKVCAVVLSFNGIELTRQCLHSLEAQDYPDLTLVVVDNASTDQTVDILRGEFPDIQIIETGQNIGYVGGNNIGIQAGLDQNADCIFLVNNDTRLDSSCVRALVECLEADPRIGVVGPMVYTWDNWKVISSAGGMIDWRKADSENVGADEEDTGQYPSRTVDFINGCGIMVRRDAIEQVGMLDPLFFMYWEETDWCQRFFKAGWRIYFEQAARMQHKAPIYSEDLGPTTLYYTLRNRILFFNRHTTGKMKLKALTHAFHGGIRGVFRLLKDGKTKHARAMWFALQHSILGKWGKTDIGLWSN